MYFVIRYASKRINKIKASALMLVILSIKLFPIYAQNVIIRAFPTIKAIAYFSFETFDTPARRFIKHEGANGTVISKTK